MRILICLTLVTLLGTHTHAVWDTFDVHHLSSTFQVFIYLFWGGVGCKRYTYFRKFCDPKSTPSKISQIHQYNLKFISNNSK